MENVEDRLLIYLKLDEVDKGSGSVYSFWTIYGSKKYFALASKNIL